MRLREKKLNAGTGAAAPYARSNNELSKVKTRSWMVGKILIIGYIEQGSRLQPCRINILWMGNILHVRYAFRPITFSIGAQDFLAHLNSSLMLLTVMLFATFMLQIQLNFTFTWCSESTTLKSHRHTSRHLLCSLNYISSGVTNKIRITESYSRIKV